MGLARDSVLSVLAEAGMFAGSLGFGVFTARAFGPEGKGAITVFSTLALTLSLFATVRFQRSATYFLASGKAKPREVVVVGLMFGLVGCALCGPVVRWAPESLLSLFAGDTKPRAVAYSLSIMAFSAYAWALTSATLAGVGAFGKRTAFASTAYLVKCGVAAAAYFLLGMEVVAFLTIIAVFEIVYAVGWIVVLPGRRPTIGQGARLFKDMLKYSLAGFAGVLADLVSLRLDIFVLGVFTSSSEVGIYGVAVSCSSVLLYVPTAMRTVLVPHVASSRGRTALTAQVIRTAWPVLAVVAILLIAAVHLLLVPVFGKPFAPAFVPFMLLVPGTLSWGIFTLLSGDMDGRGRPGLVSAASMGAATATIVLDLILIPRYGASGAAMASTAAYTLAALVLAVVFSRLTGTGLSKLILTKASDFAPLVRPLIERTQRDRGNKGGGANGPA